MPDALLTCIWVLALAWVLWRFVPRRKVPSMNQAEAKAAIGRGEVVVYWRPGCSYCSRLKAALSAEQTAKATWVNIWEDEDAAAYVRSVNDGNEVVPTVVMDGIAVTNPKPALVAEKLS